MKDAHLSADDLTPLVDKLSTEERIRLAYYALKIARAMDSHAKGPTSSLTPLTLGGLPDMTEFHERLGVRPYPGNSVVEMRSEERG